MTPTLMRTHHDDTLGMLTNHRVTRTRSRHDTVDSLRHPTGGAMGRPAGQYAAHDHPSDETTRTRKAARQPIATTSASRPLDATADHHRRIAGGAQPRQQSPTQEPTLRLFGVPPYEALPIEDPSSVRLCAPQRIPLVRVNSSAEGTPSTPLQSRATVDEGAFSRRRRSGTNASVNDSGRGGEPASDRAALSDLHTPSVPSRIPSQQFDRCGSTLSEYIDEGVSKMSSGMQRKQGGNSFESDNYPARLLSVLRAVQNGNGTTRLTDIARETQIPLSTVHRLLTQLSTHDLVTKRGNQYQLGFALRELTKPPEVTCRKFLRRMFKPLLITVHERTQYIVGLATAGQYNVDFIDIVYSRQYCGVIRRIEEDTPLSVSAAGKVLLAYDQTLMVNHTQRTDSVDRSLLGALHTELVEIHTRGMAHTSSDESTGISAVAAPVFGNGDQPVAALSIGAYRDQFNALAASGLVRQAAKYACVVMQRHRTR